jgi:hypothetical protein
MKNTKLTNKLYFLKCPDTLEIRYIGITCKNRLNDRLSEHINESKTSYSHKSNWINKIISENKRPIIESILDNLTYEESLIKEVEYIKKYREEGYNLLNITEGGDFNPAYLDSVKRKISLKQIENQQSKSKEEKNNDIIIQKNRKPILQFDFQNNLINEFLSLREITRQFNYDRKTIGLACKGSFKQAYGFIWRYKQI